MFTPKPWVNPFGKMSIFRLFELLVYIAQKGVSSFQNIVKDVFLAYIASKQKVGKMAIFGPKPWVNPFGKMSIFQLFELLVFIAQKGIFSFQNIVKEIFLVYIAPKKNVAKMAIFGQKPWVNPFRKMSISRVFQLLVFIAQKAISFVLEYRKRHVPCLYCAKKSWKNGHFWTKTIG